MQSEESERFTGNLERFTGDSNTAGLRDVAPLRLITLQTPNDVMRRRAPRRKIVADFMTERRRGERRHAKPGIDGLLRTVLAEEWS